MTRRPARVLACAVLLVGLVPAVAGATPAEQTVPVAAPAAEEPVARGVIVKTRAADSTLRRAVQKAAGSALDVRAPADVTASLTTVDFGEVVEYADAAAVAAEIAERPDVEWAVPNGRVKPTAVAPNSPDDPRFGEQLQLWDASAKAAGGYATKAPAAWGATRGDGVVVAVVDTGVRPDHPDLQGRLLPGYDFVGEDLDVDGLPRTDEYRYYTANDGDGRDADPSDPGDWIEADDTYCYGEAPGELEPSSWHGTHVAGIVAATQDDGIGISGVAPEAQVLPVRVLGTCGGWDADIAAGIEWATGGSVAGAPANPNPAKVVNLSLGQSLDTKAQVRNACMLYSELATRARSRDAVLVAAAGNDFGAFADYSVPAACSGVISVAATNRAGRAAVYSSTGSTVDISAYGGDSLVERRGVVSTVDTGSTTPVGAGYDEYDGTSMAAPAVAGAAALLMSLDVPASRVETELKKATQPFRAYSKAAKKTKVKLGGRTYVFDTNCSTKKCGKGILDLSRVGVAVTTSGLPSKTRYGTETAVTVTARLSSGAAWRGPVELRRGSTVLARGTVGDSGSTVLTVPGTSWTVGKNSVRAVLTHGSAASSSRTVTVSKATSATTQEVPDSVDPAARASLVATVAVPGVTAPTGTLTVYDGKKKIASASLKTSHGGQVTITLPKLKKGKHTLKTVYGGSKTVGGSTSAKRTVVAETPVVVIS